MTEKAPKLVKARWVGTCESELTDGTVLVPGVTIAQVPEDEARDSANWEPVGKRAAKGDS